MSLQRRNFLRAGLAALAGAVTPQKAIAEEPGKRFHAGCLVDTTLCIGCRKCEEACNRRNELPAPDRPFSDPAVLRRERRPDEQAFTVVNQYSGRPSPDQPGRSATAIKVQCMHCLVPSCVSACVVGALRKAPDGAVVYNPGLCLGCRYCLVACPFEIPAYEFFKPLNPKVRKCEFCSDPANHRGADPACAAACPTEALVFGDRGELLTVAHERIKAKPNRYLPHVYGEREVGGTSWLYLSGRPVTELGLLEMPENAPALRTEAIQHGIFKYGIIPVALYGALGGIMWINHRRQAGGGDPDDHRGGAR